MSRENGQSSPETKQLARDVLNQVPEGLSHAGEGIDAITRSIGVSGRNIGKVLIGGGSTGIGLGSYVAAEGYPKLGATLIALGAVTNLVAGHDFDRSRAALTTVRNTAQEVFRREKPRG